ncbi:PH domain-containing protein [Nesterenkonia aerolata]|uniref:PH domain-containing protein n=1 Tax=Nesterenkonia aerolata TaxID=3074079 RepID=A0ABU2DU97_9MICC|nr:PH domain-containing protein [Nesterenkonia sp. LY-0111]MDR8020069.1 PH domain-containing protein [Nesterenkonia sp. LY-0111]
MSTQDSPEPTSDSQDGRTSEDAAPQEPAPEERALQEPASESWFDETWTKVHPLSPLVRGWVTLIAIPAVFLSYNWENWVTLWEVITTGQAIDEFERDPTPFLIGGGVFLLVVALIFGGFLLSWWFTRYKITDEHVMVKSGVFVRQHRQARIDRVQAVDLRQPLLARLTGLAELKFEVADGEGTAASLQFLKRGDAEDLRRDIMDRAAGRGAPVAPDAGAHQTAGLGGAEDSIRGNRDDAVAGTVDGTMDSGSDDGAVDDAVRSAAHHGNDGTTAPALGSGVTGEQLIARVPVARLIGSVVLGWGTLVVAVLAVLWLISMGVIALGTVLFTQDQDLGALVAGVGAVGWGSFLTSLIPALIVVVMGYYQQINKGFRFTASMTQAGLRMRYGLLETTTQTVPPGRVQALQISQSPLWRPCGWYTVKVVVAGYGAGESRSVLLPVGKIDDVMAVTAAMFPDLRVENPQELFLEGLRGRGDEGSFTCGPKRAWLFDPWVRRRRGFATTPSTAMFRDGRLVPRLTMMAHERIQSLSIEGGPLARRRRLARIHLHVPAGPFQVMVQNQDIEAVRELFQRESEHAAVARRFSDRNQWMLPEEQQQFEKLVNTETADAEGPVVAGSGRVEASQERR